MGGGGGGGICKKVHDNLKLPVPWLTTFPKAGIGLGSASRLTRSARTHLDFEIFVAAKAELLYFDTVSGTKGHGRDGTDLKEP